jgi:iron complex transport system ATP-binding protein
MLRAEGLSLSSGGRALLSSIDAGFIAGRFTVLAGPNGAGKSSLLKCLAGQLAPCAGSVTLDGDPVLRIDPRMRGRRIGYLPQSAALHWNIPVRELVSLGRFPHGDARSEHGQAAIENALRDMDLAELADRLTSTLSGGERARALLARVLAGEPQWILADEPLTALDVSHQFELLDRFKTIAGRGVGVIVVAHDLPLVAQQADDALLLQDGRAVAFGPAADILSPERLEQVFGARFFHVDAPDGSRLLASVSGSARPDPN